MIRAVSLNLVAIGTFATAVAPVGAQMAPRRSVDARMARVLSGLRGPVEVVGRPLRTWSLVDRMERYKAPGVSIAVIEGGKVVWEGGFGVKEAGGRDSVTAATLFQAASISKPVAATGMLRLVAAGKLDLDLDVNRYLKTWKVPENRFTATEKVTLRRLASHSAGLTVHGFPGYADTAMVPSVVQILNGEKPANTRPVRVDTTPGAIWRYAGGGTTVEQLVMTDVTGEPFPALMQRLVLTPAGMTRSTYEQPLPPARWADAARAHKGNGSVIAARWHTYPEMAAAGLWTTAGDLARWALAIAAAWSGRDTTLLPHPIAREMLTVQKGSFGIGPSLNGSGRAFRFGHGGSNEGFRSDLLYFPEAGVGAAVMVNSDNGGELIQEIEYAIAAEYGWPGYEPKKVTAVTLEPGRLAARAGEYEMQFNRDRFPLTLRLENGALIMQVPFMSLPEELVPVEENVLIGLSRGWRFELNGDSLSVIIDPGTRLRGRKKQ
jgi:CubicO group peptidase (beta-lactamase class C family)